VNAYFHIPVIDVHDGKRDIGTKTITVDSKYKGKSN